MRSTWSLFDVTLSDGRFLCNSVSGPLQPHDVMQRQHYSTIIGAVKVVASHALLYVGTYWVLNFVEDNLTSSGGPPVVIIFLSLPISFLLSLWAVGGLPHPDRRAVVRSAVIAALISPFSFMLWLTVYVGIVGYHG